MPKNQKSITQFFSHKQEISPNKCVLAQLENHENKSAKRKESSPIQLQNIDGINKSCSTSSTEDTWHIETNGLNTKKIKLDLNDIKKSPLKITTFKADKITPKKENSNTTTLSPRKYCINNKNLMGDCRKTKESDNISESENSWSSLAHLCKDDVLEVNKLANGFDKNEEYTKVNRLANGNLVNKRVKTPKKVLQFHDCVQNSINDIKKSVITQKSPEKGKTVCACHY